MRPYGRCFSGLLILCGAVGCGGEAKHRAPLPQSPVPSPPAKSLSKPTLSSPLPVTRAERPSSTAASTPRPLTVGPAQPEAPIIPLMDEAKRWAFLSRPDRKTAKRPLVVAAHGAGDHPRWHCEMWRRIVGDRAFVLCPQGAVLSSMSDSSRYFFPGHPALAGKIDQSMRLLRTRYAATLDERAPIFAGYSQGATMGAHVLARGVVPFTAAVLIEGGFGRFEEWNVASARRFYQHGGRRVLIACGRPKCERLARVTAGYLRRAGLETRVIYAPDAGHSYGGPMESALRDSFSWVVAGDPRWR